MQRLKKICFGLVLAVPMLVAGQSGKKNPGFDEQAARKEIDAINLRYIATMSKSDSVGMAGFYTPDARILHYTEPPTIGNAALVSFFGSMMRNGVTQFSCKTDSLWGSDNNLVVEEGTASFALSNGTVVTPIRYLLVWKRIGGELKIFRDTYIPDKENK